MTTTDVQGKIKAGGRLYHLWLNGSTDGTATETKIRDIGGTLLSLGTALAGQTIEELCIQCSDGSILTTAILYGADNGIVGSWRGNERTIHTRYNLEAKKLRIPIQKGYVLKTNCAD